MTRLTFRTPQSSSLSLTPRLHLPLNFFALFWRKRAPAKPPVYIASIDGDHDGSFRAWMIEIIKEEAGDTILKFLPASLPLDFPSATPPDETLIIEAAKKARLQLGKDGCNLFIWGRLSQTQLSQTAQTATLELRLLDAEGTLTGSLGVPFTTAFNIPGLKFAPQTARSLTALILALAAPLNDGTNAALTDHMKSLAKRLEPMRHCLGNLLPLSSTERTQLLTSYGIFQYVLGYRLPDAERLKQSAGAYREALSEFNPDDAPLDWANIQNNLGKALYELGKTEAVTGRLEEAALAHRAALDEQKRHRAGVDWTRTQNNLAYALHELGRRETGNEKLHEAAAAFLAVLDEQNRQGLTRYFGRTLNNLGLTLHELGLRETGTDQLQKAVTAFRGAIDEFKPGDTPFYRGRVHTNLGVSLYELGKCKPGTEMLQEAIKAYVEAIKQMKQDPASLDWQRPQNYLRIARASIQKRKVF